MIVSIWRFAATSLPVLLVLGSAAHADESFAALKDVAEDQIVSMSEQEMDSTIGGTGEFYVAPSLFQVPIGSLWAGTYRSAPYGASDNWAYNSQSISGMYSLARQFGIPIGNPHYFYMPQLYWTQQQKNAILPGVFSSVDRILGNMSGQFGSGGYVPPRIY